MKLAHNAEPILRARLRGMRPDETVIVSLVGPLDIANHVVRADQARAYDWRWAHGLDVVVYVDGTDWVQAVKAIALQRPAYLGIWNAAGWGATAYLAPTPEDIEQPVRRWAYELDFLPWMDFQNEDFAVGRTYGRDENGVPYAIENTETL